MLTMFLASVRTFINVLQAYDAHQASDIVPPSREPGLRKIGRDLAAAKEWMLRKYRVNLMHQIKRCLIKPDWCVRG